MVWFRVDDDFYDHPKVTAIPARQRNAAIGLWARAGSYSARHLTDGRIPADLVEQLASATLAEALVKAGLWIRLDDGDYLFRDWADRNPSAEEILWQREREKEKKRRQRAGRYPPK